MTDARAFHGCRFSAEVILGAVRWYLRFPLSFRDLERRLADRGVAVDHTTMYRWVQRFAPALERRLRRHLGPCRRPWHVDETCVRVAGQWRYLYRAVDGTGRSPG
jgi:transposase-like protein